MATTADRGRPRRSFLALGAGGLALGAGGLGVALAGCTGDDAEAGRADLHHGVNVADHGARGDGAADDTDAIADAVTAAGKLAAQSGRSVPVRLMAGTHVIRLRPQRLDPNIYAGIELPSNVHLLGAGRGATVIKLREREPAEKGHILHNAGLHGGDSGITVSDLTIDGNGAHQTQLNSGLSFLRASDIAVSKVTVTNVYGTAAYPPGETFHFNLNSCARVTYTDCAAIGTAGTQGSGFADNSSTNVSYSGCMAVAMSAGMGFASWHGACIGYVGCRAQQCGANGFNAEYGQDLTYAACIAGAEASDQASGYVYDSSAQLGNAGSGFVINGTRRAVISGCISRRNGSGVSVVSTIDVVASCHILGGYYSDNTDVGIYFSDPQCSQQSFVSTETQALSNGSNWSVNGGVGQFYASGVPGPAQPSGQEVANPFPFRVVVYLNRPSNTDSVVLNGSYDIGQAPMAFLNPGDTIRVDYRTDPGFLWLRA